MQILPAYNNQPPALRRANLCYFDGKLLQMIHQWLLKHRIKFITT